MVGAFSRRACDVLSRAFSSPISFHLFVFGSRERKRPGGLRFLISDTILLAIRRFSLLNLAVKYTRFLFSTRSRNLSFPGCELIEPPLPHKTSLSVGSLTHPMSFSPSVGVTKDLSSLSLIIDDFSMVVVCPFWCLLCYCTNSNPFPSSKIVLRVSMLVVFDDVSFVFDLIFVLTPILSYRFCTIDEDQGLLCCGLYQGKLA